MLKFGPLKIEPGLALAPMAGITNHPFRLLAKEQGCRLVYSEMISAKGLMQNGRRSRDLLYYTERERPLGFQLFGSEPPVLAAAAARLESLGADFIDLNLGCPTPKVVRNGDGGALMCKPGLCSEIFCAVVDAVSCPVTVKMRSGWDESSINAPEIAARAEQAGLQAAAVHGRTVRQGYSGRADWSVVREVKKCLHIPVIGNGDIDSPQFAEEMLSYSGCDGIMIGRAARGNPWIFAQVLARLENSRPPEPPSIEEVVDMALRHFLLLSELKGEAAAAREMRRHTAWYVKGLPGAARVRQKLVGVSSFKEAQFILREFARRPAR